MHFTELWYLLLVQSYEFLYFMLFLDNFFKNKIQAPNKFCFPELLEFNFLSQVPQTIQIGPAVVS